MIRVWKHYFLILTVLWFAQTLNFLDCKIFASENETQSRIIKHYNQNMLEILSLESKIDAYDELQSFSGLLANPSIKLFLGICSSSLVVAGFNYCFVPNSSYFQVASSFGLGISKILFTGIVLGQTAIKTEKCICRVRLKNIETNVSDEEPAFVLNTIGQHWERDLNAIDPVRAFKAFKQASLLGSEQAKYNLARCFRDGIGVAFDLDNAKRLFLECGEEGKNEYITLCAIEGQYGLDCDEYPNTCPVCLEPILTPDHELIVPACGHKLFHPHCLKISWKRNNNCMICSKEIKLEH